MFSTMPRRDRAWAGGVLAKSSPIICTPTVSAFSCGSSRDERLKLRSARVTNT
jgi:hypothetical protein